MATLPPAGPGHSPGALPPMRRYLGRILNRRVGIAAVVICCGLLALIWYGVRERSIEQALRRHEVEARPQSADASGILKDAPTGAIAPPAFHQAVFAVPPLPPKPPKPFNTTWSTPPADDNGVEAYRKQAWATYWANLAKLQQAKLDEYQKALSAKTSVSWGQASGAAPATATTLSAPTAAPSFTGLPGMGGLPGMPGFGGFGAPDISGVRQKEAFARQTGDLGKDDVLMATRKPAPSPYAVMAGSYISAVAETAANSDAPGEFIGRVSANVYDTAHGACVIIPQGAKLIGRYDAEVTVGQSRLPGVLTRIIYPDASSVDLGAMEAADKSGAAGFDADRDTHFWERLGNGLIIGISGIGANIMQSVPFGGSFYSGPQNAVDGVAEMGLSIPPTLTVPAGRKFIVITGKDLVLPPWSCGGHRIGPQMPIMSSDDQ